MQQKLFHCNRGTIRTIVKQTVPISKQIFSVSMFTNFTVFVLLHVWLTVNSGLTNVDLIVKLGMLMQMLIV